MPDAALYVARAGLGEVISPATERADRSRKMRIYAREGVPHLWLLDPVIRPLEVLRLEHGRQVLRGTHSETESVAAVPFDRIEIDLGSLWPDPAAPSPIA